MLLKWTDDSNENLIFILFYKHGKDENWQDVVLKNVCKSFDSAEYRVEYTISNAKPGKYICRIQSKCDFGMSESSTATFVSREEAEVSSAFPFSETVMRYLNLFITVTPPSFVLAFSKANSIALESMALT